MWATKVSRKQAPGLADIRGRVREVDEVEVVGEELLVGLGPIVQYLPPCLPQNTEDYGSEREFL